MRGASEWFGGHDHSYAKYLKKGTQGPPVWRMLEGSVTFIYPFVPVGLLTLKKSDGLIK